MPYAPPFVPKLFLFHTVSQQQYICSAGGNQLIVDIRDHSDWRCFGSHDKEVVRRYVLSRARQTGKNTTPTARTLHLYYVHIHIVLSSFFVRGTTQRDDRVRRVPGHHVGCQARKGPRPGAPLQPRGDLSGGHAPRRASGSSKQTPADENAPRWREWSGWTLVAPARYQGRWDVLC